MNKAYVKYILALLLFGSNGVLASQIKMDSYAIVFWRTLIGSLFLMLFLLVGKKGKTARINKRHVAFVIVSGTAMGASWMLLYEAYVLTGVSVASLAYYCGPVIVMAAAPILFRERITGAKALGLASVLLGLLFVNNGLSLQNGASRGLVYGLGSALFYALMIVFNKKAESISGLQNATCQLAASFITVALFTLLKQGAVFSIARESVAPVLILGIINTGLGCYLYFSSIGWLSAATVSIVGYLEPLSALLFSALFLHERLSALQGAGGLLILAGAAFGEAYHRAQVTGS